jgi:hypothetical protein
MIETNCEKNILNFKSISNDENYSKFNISPTLGLTIIIHLYEIPLLKGFPPIPKASPSFIIFSSFDFVEFHLTNLQ